MYFTTNQKESFRNLGPIERAQPIVHVKLMLLYAKKYEAVTNFYSRTMNSVKTVVFNIENGLSFILASSEQFKLVTGS